ncbi:MAG: YidC/Oxa1 family membrane protein insertase, partial [Acidimicrobiales bacterium]
SPVTALSRLVGWVLAAFYSVIPNFGAAIILLGLTFMFLVVPLTLKSTRSMLAMQKLQPKMKQLQQQYKHDRVALNQALTQLYKDEGVSPFGSCIPTLIPLPLFYVLYRVIEGLSHYKCPGKGVAQVCYASPQYINHHTKMYAALMSNAHRETAAQIAAVGKHGAQIPFFGLDLANDAWTTITKHLGAGQVFGALLLLLVMIAANYYQQVQITNLNPMVRQSQQANPQMRMMRYFPIVFGLLCVRFPSGLVLYYAVSALFRVTQQYLMYRYDPKVKALVAHDDRDIDVLEAGLDDGGDRKLPKALPLGPRQVPARSNGPRRNAKPARTGPSTNGKANGKAPGKSPSRYAGASGSNQRNRNRRRKGR